MMTFRIAITTAVMAIITTLAFGLILIQAATIRAAATGAAYSAMDFASANTVGRLEADISEMSTVVRVLAAERALKSPSSQSNADVIVVFKAALQELPQADSLYVGYDDGSWLQVRRLDVLRQSERTKLGAPAEAFYNINMVRPTAEGDLPMRRIFQNAAGVTLAERELRDYGYDVRKRGWYRDTMQAARAVVSSPYASFSLGTPMITLSAPLQESANGVIAADLKLDNFSNQAQAERPGEHGVVIIFDQFGSLIAHPEYDQLLAAMHQSNNTQLPDVGEIRSGLIGARVGREKRHRRQRHRRDRSPEDLRFTLHSELPFSQRKEE